MDINRGYGLFNKQTNVRNNMTKYQEFFAYRKRNDETKYWCLEDGAPSELRDLVYEIHYQIFEGCLPNDWVYDVISQAINELEDNGNDLDDINIECDCYYGQLYKWLGHSFSHGFCNKAVEEGYCEGKDIYKTIGCMISLIIFLKI
jgi:hypothetical protein